jgi:ketosteroid isomerase-like protein
MADTDFEAAVRRQCAQFADHYTRGDLAGLVAHYYTSDACMLAPTAPVLRGTQAIQAGLASLREAGFVGLTLEPVHLEYRQDLGYEVGRATLPSAAGEQIARYIVAWKKGGDGWRVQWDMFAMDAI